MKIRGMNKVFICYRYNGTDANQVLSNIGVAYRVAFDLIKEGYTPYIPHSDCLIAMMFGKEIPLQFYYDYTLEWLAVCDIICIVSDNKPLSPGCQREVEFAKRKNMKIIYRKAR